MMKLALLVVMCVAAASVHARTLWHQLDNYDFEAYQKEFSRSYCPGPECEMRRARFEQVLREIKAHNSDPSKTWKEGVNELTDRTAKEIRTQFKGYDKNMAHTVSGGQLYTAHKEKNALSDIPGDMDWRAVVPSVVTAIKDQGRCGSCWTFATAESVESHVALKTGKLYQLSEQQIASCSPNPQHCGGTGGCSGGTAEIGYNGIAINGGLATEWTYPYISYDGTNYDCKLVNQSNPMRRAAVSGWVKLPSNQYEPLVHAVATIGPVAISVDASSWSKYESGVFNGCSRDSPDVDHAVVLEGYGCDADGLCFWTVRNSWGPTFGEDGRIRLFRQPVDESKGEQPACAVDTTPSHGSGCDGGPKNVTVCGTCAILFDTAFPIVA